MDSFAWVFSGLLWVIGVFSGFSTRQRRAALIDEKCPLGGNRLGPLRPNRFSTGRFRTPKNRDGMEGGRGKEPHACLGGGRLGKGGGGLLRSGLFGGSGGRGGRPGSGAGSGRGALPGTGWSGLGDGSGNRPFFAAMSRLTRPQGRTAPGACPSRWRRRCPR